MGATGYESLLRTVYNCNKGGTKGADANIYRNMEMTERLLSDMNLKKTDEEKKQDHKNAFTEVRMYVRNALNVGLEKIKYRASRQDIDKITLMQETLWQPKFYNKAALDAIMQHAEEIFFNNGLEEG